jgi:hypothetical protein
MPSDARRVRSSSTLRSAAVLLPLAISVVAVLVPLAQRAADRAARPGLQEADVTLLPNGWRIAPSGQHVQVGDLPLNMIASPDGRFLIITNNGWM